MDYLIKGYPHGMEGRMIEFKKVNASSPKDALSKIDKSIWYEYHANIFNQTEYDNLKAGIHIEIR